MLELLSLSSTPKPSGSYSNDFFSSIQAVIILYASSALSIEYNERDRCFVTSEDGLIVIVRDGLRPFAVFDFGFFVVVVATSQVYLLWMIATFDMIRNRSPE